jgi:hypothetical protein
MPYPFHYAFENHHAVMWAEDALWFVDRLVRAGHGELASRIEHHPYSSAKTRGWAWPTTRLPPSLARERVE